MTGRWRRDPYARPTPLLDVTIPAVEVIGVFVLAWGVIGAAIDWDKGWRVVVSDLQWGLAPILLGLVLAVIRVAIRRRSH